MPTSRTLPRAEWRSFFDAMSDVVLGKRVEIEAASLELGDQIIVDWVPLLGITYDSRDDILDVSLSGLSHLIRMPREILVQGGERGIETIAVVTDDDVKQVLRFKDPLMLPAATPGGKGTA
jgi:hypothetical protein